MEPQPKPSLLYNINRLKVKHIKKIIITLKKHKVKATNWKLCYTVTKTMYKLHCGMHKAAVEPSDFYTVDTKRILPTLLHSRG